MIRDFDNEKLDITQREGLDQALRLSEQRYRLALHGSRVAVWECDTDLRYTFGANWQPPVTDPAQFLGKRDDEILPYDSIREMIEMKKRVLATGAGERREITLLAADKTFYFEMVVEPIYDLHGVVTGLRGTAIDITDRKRTEEAARHQANLVRLSFDAIIVWRAGGGIETWNQGAEMLYGFTESEAIGQRLNDLLKPVFPVSHSEIKKVLTDQGKWEGEVRHRAKDGRELIVSTRLQHVASDDGTVRVLAINRDITERKRMEEERAAEGRRKDEFLSMLGHELRNPLATISTAVQLLSGALTDEQRVSLSGMMDRQVKLMGRLLDDLLDLGRMTHGYIQLRKERIDLSKFLQHVTEVTQSTAAERGQELTLRLPSEILRFKADEARLEQIAINLLSNASKYTPQGGKIEFSGIREGSEVVIRCKDNGRGIPPEMQERIFEPFTRLEPFSDSRGEASLGIGLALVKRLVELHGGTVSVESSGPGMGSEFVVRLPLESAPSDQPVAPEAKPASAAGLLRSIVLVEDNSDAAGTMVIFLEKAGYRVTLFRDAFSALAGLSDLKPHAILLDIGLPGMDGYKLAAKLKEKPHLHHTLFIALSGFKRREATKSKDDFDYYFNKPVDLPALMAFLDPLHA